jgi:hypothetical protein
LDAFRQALLDDPGDDDSRHDYEVILRLLESPDDDEPAPTQTPAGETPQPTTGPGDDPGGTATPPPGGGDPGTPGAGRPGSEAELERRLADIDAEIARINREAGEDIEPGDAVRILELLAERERIASVRDALGGGGDPNDY